MPPRINHLIGDVPFLYLCQYLLQIGAFNAAADMALSWRWFPPSTNGAPLGTRALPPLAFSSLSFDAVFLLAVRRSGSLEIPSLASYSNVVCLCICLNFLILGCFDVEMWFCMRFLLPCLLFTSYSLLLSPFFEGLGPKTPKVLESWAQNQLPNSPKVLKSQAILTYAGRAVLGHGPSYPPCTAQPSHPSGSSGALRVRLRWLAGWLRCLLARRLLLDP
uniref:Uncharacterized protein n=1 Tax=Ananas comosus var. bracteatus TaxID=296719 RepID=A0A6V7NJE9_ANACO|nr:unnamed protein product [Ananas comosus var. bracteatus]